MTANHETYLLMANTQNDMEDWVKTIRRVIWAPFGGGIFGQKLEETVRYERRYGDKLAPMLVEQCADFIRQRGLQEEGLFRLPGQANLVKELQDAFDCGEKELPEPVVPFSQYHHFLACTHLLSKDDTTVRAHTFYPHGIAELRKLVAGLPPVNYNLLTYICRFLDEVQSYSGVNKMSVQNLATVFGPNILRPKIEDPVAMMEGTVLVQQLMAVLIGRHDALFPEVEEEEDVAVAMDPRNSLAGRFDLTRSPPLTLKKNPAFSKGSGIVTNGSFSSASPGADPGSGTKMGTSVTNGSRLGVSSTDVVNGSLNGRHGLWVPNGHVTLRDNSRTRDGEQGQNRLEDKQSVDSATWSTSSCEISLNGTSSHSALHSLVAGLKQEMNKQKSEYDARIKSLEQRNLDLESDMAGLNEELDQERKKYTMVEIKLRNAERAKEDAERRNHMLQKEMEQFFSTFGDLTAASTASEPSRRSDRGNSIWIQ
ncbi:hypothetical protein NHX12_027469 [Muraenolepis orangiensis]|uniref:Rho GTPase activating protein 24 n=1 Tax=Muraenolepis orangiensis TaxID=630683 RepID=A0A9Q0ECC9_9TELE|nr:hypothetical protein NHX12_027469 [Muraenolepis orangiensis]